MSKKKQVFHGSDLEKIEEIIPWFNNTYILKLNKGKYEITVSRSRVKLFRQLMNI